MNIKIFGGSGFFGSFLAKKLAGNGHNITIFDKDKPTITSANVFCPTGESPTWINPIKFIGGDIRKYRDVYYAIDKGDFIINLSTITQYPINELQYITGINVLGSANVVKASIDNHAVYILHTSTGSVYSIKSNIPIDETQPTNPISIYGHTNLYGETICNFYANKIPIAILRMPQIVSPGKFTGANKIIMKLMNNKRPTIFGDGSTICDFTYIEDIVSAIESTLSKQKTGIYNIGSGTSRTILEFYEWSCRLLDISNIEPSFSSPRYIDFPVFEYDITKARDQLGYSPKHNLEQTIEKTINQWSQFV